MEFLSDNLDMDLHFFPSESGRFKNKILNTEKHFKKIKEQFNQKIKFPQNLPELGLSMRPDGLWETAYIIASKFLKKPISEFHFKSEILDYTILDFFEKNSTCLIRITNESNLDSSYLFLYENTFFYLSMGTKEESRDKLLVISLTAFYSTDSRVPYEIFDQFKKPDQQEKPQIGIIKSGRAGIHVSKINLTHSQTFSFDHYNDDFVEFEKNIVTQLSENKPGLFLLHGEPGTGKSSAIRYLIEKVERNFIFVPPQMISQLSSPDFADIITDSHRGSVLVIEDAEKALMKRESEDGFSNSTLVSSILNLTDGLYADLGQLAIIATYNCDRNLIDKALLRKGRLKAEYRFDKLNKEKSKALIKQLGKSMEVSEAMTLADIFNSEDQYSNNKVIASKKVVGFGSA